MAPQNKPSGLVAALTKRFGEGSARLLTDKGDKDVTVYPTGALPLDRAVGVGGLPRGRVVELFGPESAGKTTLALHVVASCQAAGDLAVFVDAEHALDPTYAQALGVDLGSLVLSQPDSGEQALDIVLEAITSGEVGLVVVDSVAALTPQAEIDGEMEQQHVAGQARLMSRALRKLAPAAYKHGTLVLFINQTRSAIGGYAKETTPGGRALRFYASVRLRIGRMSQLKDGTDPIGLRAVVKVAKNKMAPPFKQAEFDIYFGKGISRAGCVLDAAIECEVVEKRGAWFSFAGDRLGQGRLRVLSKLEQDAPLLDAIEEAVREA